MSLEYYVTVTDLALCQRCPALFAYKFHKNEKSAWRVGIKGNGEFYGSAFHKEISEKFFHAASNPKNPLFDEINFAASKGAESLKNLVREKFFIPFIEAQGEFFTSAQILAMSNAAENWLQGMLIFFENSRPVFLKPEWKLEGAYKFQDSKLIIKGRYDALIFNPEKLEARLFEFKGFMKSNITVPLSQTLIYAWLLRKSSGIIPSIEIIYLDEKSPEIFEFNTVRDMIISGLPKLFNSAMDIILLRRLPGIMQDKKLCDCCKFKDSCRDDMKKIFRSKNKFLRKYHRGASLLSLMLFFMAAIIITSQVFFFSNTSSQALKEDRDVQSVRIQLESLIEGARVAIKDNPGKFQVGGTINWENFFDEDSTTDTTKTDTRKKIDQAGISNFYKHKYYYKNDYESSIDHQASINLYATIHDLSYTYEDKTLDLTSDHWKNLNQRIFPAMKDHFLIRAWREMPAGNKFMIQALVYKNGKIKTYEEIWW